MLGLFGTLNLAATSLATQQESMAVAGQNMANANNPAYAVEQAVVQTSAPIETMAGEEGTGANIVSISEVRDALLDSQIQSENSAVASYTAQQSASKMPRPTWANNSPTPPAPPPPPPTASPPSSPIFSIPFPASPPARATRPLSCKARRR